MKTDDLIKVLGADTATAAMPLQRSWRMALLIAVVLAGVAFFAMLGPRADIADAMHHSRFLFKFVLTVGLAASAWAAARALSRPEGGAGLWWIAVVPALLVGAIVLEMSAMPADRWRGLMMGSNSRLCLTFIPLIGIGPLAAFIVALRHGAPARPGLSGAVAGLLAGGVAATFYAAHCVDDSPLFVAVWYGLAIAGLSAAGAVAAKVWVRW